MKGIIERETAFDGPVPWQMMVLGTFSHRLGKNDPELKNRLNAVMKRWMLLGQFWTVRVRMSLRFLLFYAVVVNAAISGLEALVLTKQETEVFNSVVVSKLRILTKRRGQTST